MAGSRPACRRPGSDATGHSYARSRPRSLNFDVERKWRTRRRKPFSYLPFFGYFGIVPSWHDPSPSLVARSGTIVPLPLAPKRWIVPSDVKSTVLVFRFQLQCQPLHQLSSLRRQPEEILAMIGRISFLAKEPQSVGVSWALFEQHTICRMKRPRHAFADIVPNLTIGRSVPFQISRCRRDEKYDLRSSHSLWHALGNNDHGFRK